jgi:hypothetical protein
MGLGERLVRGRGRMKAEKIAAINLWLIPAR